VIEPGAERIEKVPGSLAAEYRRKRGLKDPNADKAATTPE